MSVLNSQTVMPARRHTDFLGRYQREVSVAGAYVLLLLALAIFRPSFFQSQFSEIWVSAAPVLIVAVGMTLIILARQIDISIGSQFSVCGTVAGLLGAGGFGLPMIIAGTVATGAVMGAINGVLVAGAGLPSIVVTLAMMVMLRGGLLWGTQGAQVGVSFNGLGWVSAAGNGWWWGRRW